MNTPQMEAELQALKAFAVSQGITLDAAINLRLCMALETVVSVVQSDAITTELSNASEAAAATANGMKAAAQSAALIAESMASAAEDAGVVR
jgi:hypothetical protein